MPEKKTPTKKQQTMSEAILAAKRDMGKLIKNTKNEFFKSSYADLGAVLDVIEQPCLDNGILLSFSYDAMAEEALLVRLTVKHVASGGMDWTTIPMPITKRDAQAMGSLITYSRRYLLTSYFNLFQQDDDGNGAVPPRNESKVKKPGKKKPPVTGIISNAQAKKLVSVAGSKGMDKAQLSAFVEEFGGWKGSGEIPADRFDDLLAALNKPSEIDDLVM